MRAVFRVINRELVNKVIDIARRENGQVTPRVPTRGIGRAAAMNALPGRTWPMTVESFINSRSKQEQAELAALMALGREPFTLFVGDVAALADPKFWTCNVGEYLASKGGLARYLEEGMRVIGL